MIPRRLRAGDQLRVVAPSTSVATVPDAVRAAAVARLEREFGFEITFGAHVEETGPQGTGPVSGRVADLHEAFADPDVAGVLAARGGHHSHHLLPLLDYDLIAANPKPFCGFSDITALQSALLARTGLVTYSGPMFTSFGRAEQVEPTIESFRQCLFTDEPIGWQPAKVWSDAGGDRAPHPGEGWFLLQPGTATGRLTGGNLVTLGLLRGTPYWPDLDGSVLVVEASDSSDAAEFDQNLTALLQTGAALRGLLIGRFQPGSAMSPELLAHLVATKPQLNGVPVLANLDVGHTHPLYTFPVGGECYLAADPGAVEMVVTRH